MSVVLLTGAAGFLGRSLCRVLGEDGHDVIGLVRSATADLGPDVEPVHGDLARPDTYRDQLGRANVVIHAAAVTGNAPPAEYRRVNVDGTRALIAACGENDAPLVFVSSIAAGFRRDFRYFYAHSKREAERLVAASGRPFVIVRPTMIFGRGAAVATGLARLATLPVVPVFGNGRTEVQPVHVQDLSRLMTDILRETRFDGSTIEVGGPEATSIESLLRQLRIAAGRTGPPRIVHLPLWSVIPPLTVLEVFARPILPVTVGQLASFANPGTAQPDPLVDRRREAMVPLATMIRESLRPGS